MNVRELRIGSLIKVNPRENQEGLLAITEIQKETVIGEMISPRPGYHFRIKFDEIVQIPITEEWLVKAGFSKHESRQDIWVNEVSSLELYFFEEKVQFLQDGKQVGKKAIQNMVELQNGYLFLAGEELVISH